MRQHENLQSLYWQKESLQNARWRLDRQIAGVMRQNKKPQKLEAERSRIMAQISALSTQMQMIERGLICFV